MITIRISLAPCLAEYIAGKYFDPELEAVHFPDTLDIYYLVWDLMSKRPLESSIDTGNVALALPNRRAGKDPMYYNYLSKRAIGILEKRIRIMMWAELHEYMDENKHIHGIQFKDSVAIFMTRYGIESISEDAMLKNYQRWRDKLRRRQKRGYSKRICS